MSHHTGRLHGSAKNAGTLTAVSTKDVIYFTR